MRGNHTEIVARSELTRSKVTNGKRTLLFGDGRSTGARRFRDLLRDYAAEAGGMDALSASGQQVVRRLAMLSVEIESMESTKAAGEHVDTLAYVAVLNAERRARSEMERLKPKPSKASSDALHEHIARRYGHAPQGQGETA